MADSNRDLIAELRAANLPLCARAADAILILLDLRAIINKPPVEPNTDAIEAALNALAKLTPAERSQVIRDAEVRYQELLLAEITEGESQKPEAQ